MLVALALSAVAAAAPIAQLSDEQLDREIAEAHTLPMSERIEALSRLFVGVPYGDLPLGEGSGIEPQPRWRTDQVDCQTFVETVLAMANATSLASARAILDDVRYANAPAAVSFASRNHFTEAQWLPSNVGKGYLREATTTVAPAAKTATLRLRREEWSRVPGLQRLASADIPDGDYPIRYLTLDEAKAKARSIPPGSVLLVVREPDPNRVVRVSHMGLVVRGAEGSLVVRHAALGDEHRVIDLEFSRFIDKQRGYKKWPVAGVALALPLDAESRAAAVTKAAAKR